MSLGAVLDKNRGIGPGFDFLRIFLAISIVFLHALTVVNQSDHLNATPFWMITYLLVPMFFALSGFLVSASAMRLSHGNFLINRGMRIVPALAVTTAVCALMIGPIFTSLPLGRYFVSSELHRYLFNVIGYVHYYLPGVFENRRFTKVNGSLWTVPYEFACYAFISVLIKANIIRTRFVVLTLVTVYLMLSVLVHYFGIADHLNSKHLSKLITVSFLGYEAQVVTAFLFAIVAYQNRYSIPYNKALFGLAVIICVCLAFFLTNDQGLLPAMRFILMPVIVYSTIFIGLSPVWLPQFLHKGDYSYGIYLYHQPFEQIVVSIFPVITLTSRYGGLFTFVCALPMVFGIAWLSWHSVEKPVLAFRKRFSAVAKIRGAA